MSGAPVDIVTMMPLSLEFGKKQGEIEGADQLMDKVRLAGLPATEAFQLVANKVLEVLEQRIANVLNGDPQAKVCLEILRAISQPEITAHEAARRYVRRFNPLTPAREDATTPEKEVFP